MYISRNGSNYNCNYITVHIYVCIYVVAFFCYSCKLRKAQPVLCLSKPFHFNHVLPLIHSDSVFMLLLTLLSHISSYLPLNT